MIIPETIWPIMTKALAEEFELEPEKMVPEAHIKNDLGLDSLDVVDMVIVLEAAFQFTIKDKAPLQKIETLAQVADFIAATMAMESDDRSDEAALAH